MKIKICAHTHGVSDVSQPCSSPLLHPSFLLSTSLLTKTISQEAYNPKSQFASITPADSVASHMGSRLAAYEVQAGS